MRNVFKTLIVASAALLLTLVACRKSPQPSPEFEQAHQRYLALTGEQREKAFLDPEMDEVLVLLGRVPPVSRDAAAANDLAITIREGQEKARRHEEELEAARNFARLPIEVDMEADVPEVVEPPPGDPVDAGPPQPTFGMTVAELREHFSRCFQPGEAMHIPGKGNRDIWVLKDLGVCRDLHPKYVTEVVLLEDGKVWGTATPGPRIEFLPDGGSRPVAP